jgi:hypothetical protein
MVAFCGISHLEQGIRGTVLVQNMATMPIQESQGWKAKNSTMHA